MSDPRGAQPRNGVVSRYDGGKARVPGDLARPVPSLNVRTTVGAVQNPLDPSGKERILVTINRNVDLLEDELKRKLISEGAYRTGRLIQAAFEVSVRSSSNWIDGIGGDPTTAQELRQLTKIERAQRAARLAGEIRKAVGEMGAKHLRMILGDGWTYGQIAIREGKSGDRGRRQVAARFRQLLEDVTEYRSAKGGRGRTA